MLRGVSYMAGGVAVLGVGQAAKLRWQYECPGGGHKLEVFRAFLFLTPLLSVKNNSKLGTWRENFRILSENSETGNGSEMMKLQELGGGDVGGFCCEV